jgi:hypothetical protein
MTFITRNDRADILPGQGGVEGILSKQPSSITINVVTVIAAISLWGSPVIVPTGGGGDVFAAEPDVAGQDAVQ